MTSKEHSSDVTIERATSLEPTEIDRTLETAAPQLRPARFDDYPGQEKTKENLRVYVEASKRRKAPLDHVILHGPPGAWEDNTGTHYCQ